MGEMDPQRKRKAIEQAMLQKRRDLSDMTVTCKDCNEEFVFTVLEQEFFIEKEYAACHAGCAPTSWHAYLPRLHTGMHSSSCHHYVAQEHHTVRTAVWQVGHTTHALPNVHNCKEVEVA